MSIVLISVLAMVALAVLFGIGLSLASGVFSTGTDPHVEEVLDALPGANCGACGYKGCRAYAEATVEGENVSLCTVGGDEVAEGIADILGVEAESLTPRRAVCHCQGGSDKCGQRCSYDGEQDCRAAHETAGGPKACLYGCLGFGTCAEVCPFDAITMSEERLPMVDPEKCTACGACVEACPRDLFTLLDMKYKIYLGCSSRDSGKSVKGICDVGCITCGLCKKKDPNEAIVIQNGLPALDYEKADGDFSVAADVCPMDSYVIEGEPREEQQPTTDSPATAGSPAS